MNKITSVLLGLFLLTSSVFAVTTFTSIGSGPFLAAGTWSQSGLPVDADGIPDANDDVIISPLHAVTVSVNSTSCANLTVNGTLQFTSIVALLVKGNYTLAGAESGTGTIRFDGSGRILTVTGTTVTTLAYHFNSNTTISALSVINKYGSTTRITNGAVVTNLGDCTIGSTTAYTFSRWINGAGANLTLKTLGFMNTGLFDASAINNTVTLNYNGSYVPKTMSGYYNLTTISSTKVLSENTIIAGSLTIGTGATLSALAFTTTVAGDWNNSGTFGAGTTGTVIFNGSAAQSIGGTSTTGFYRLEINSTNTVTLNRNATVSNLLTMTSGTFSTGTFSLTGAAGITATGGDLQLGRLTTVPELTGAYSLTGGTLTFNGAGAQTIRGGQTYFNMVAAGAGTKTAGGALDINGSVTISSTLDVSVSNFAVSLAGNWINNGVFIARNGTVTFDGATTVSGIFITTFRNVNITGTLIGHAATMNVAGNWVNGGTYTHNSGIVMFNGISTVSGASTTSFNDITISGTLTGHTTSMNVAGNWSNDGTYTHNSGTVVFNGVSTVSGASTTTFNNVTITGTLTGHATNMNLVGNYINNGTYNNNNGTLTFNGAAVQTISGANPSVFENLTISNTAGVGTGVSISSGTYTLDGVLTLSNGTFSTGGNSFTMTSSAARTARIAPIAGTGAVSGNFNIERWISARDTTWCDMASPNNGTVGDWDNMLYFSYPHNPYGSPKTFSNIVQYTESIADYEGVNAGTALSPGKGFEVFLTDNASLTTYTPVRVTTIGVPNTGPVVIPLSYTPAMGIYRGQNLIGNPFASAVTVGSFTFTNASNYVDVYDYTTANNQPSNNAYQPVSGAGVLPAGQGFWAYATSAGASITIPEAAKSANTTTNLRSNEIEPFMKLVLSSADKSITSSYMLRIASDDVASDGWDIKDHPFRKSPSKIAVSITGLLDDGGKLAINTFSSLNDKYAMPLSIQVGISGFYKIEASDLEFMKDYKYILLEDKLLNKMTDFKTTSSYSFKFNNTDKEDRFVLHFSKNDQPRITSNVPANDFENRVEILPSAMGNTINFNLGETSNTRITVTNLIGQSIIDALVIDANSQTVNVFLPEGFSGMYILKIESAKGSIHKKFIKK